MRLIQLSASSAACFAETATHSQNEYFHLLMSFWFLVYPTDIIIFQNIFLGFSLALMLLFAFPPFFIVFSCSTYLFYFLKCSFIFISPSRYVDGLREDVASLVQRPQVGMLYRRASAARSSVWVLVITSRGEARRAAGCSWFFATHTVWLGAQFQGAGRSNLEFKFVFGGTCPMKEITYISEHFCNLEKFGKI